MDIFKPFKKLLNTTLIRNNKKSVSYNNWQTLYLTRPYQTENAILPRKYHHYIPETKMNHKLSTVITSLLLLCISLQAESIKLTSLEWEPYVGQKIQDNGFITEIIKESYKAQEINDVTIFYLAWAKTVELAQIGNVDGCYPAYYRNAMESDFIFSDPMPCGPLAFLKLKDTTFNYTGKVEELKPYKIGVVSGYTNTKEIDSSKELTLIQAKDDITNLRNLVAGKVDVAIVDPLVAQAYMANDKLLQPFAEKVAVVEPVLEKKDVHIAFSKKVENINEKIAKFNAGLKAIKENGTYDKILTKHKVDKILKAAK